MKQCLILLTIGYPFGPGDMYLENELPFLAGKFDKILIFAQDMGRGVEAAWPVPDGADAYNISTKSKKAGRLGDISRGFFRSFFRTERYTEDKKYVGRSSAKRLFLEYFEARSTRHFKETARLLERYDLSGFDRVVIYSYWFFATARTGVFLKEHLRHHNVSFISRGHRYDIYDYANRLSYLPERDFLFEHVDRLYACSIDGQRYLCEKFPRWRDKVDCAYLGTRDRGLSPIKNDGIFRIVSCSRAAPVKRVDRIARALALLRDSGLKLSWVHIGDGKELPKIKRLAAEQLGFMDVEFKGRLSNADVFGYYLNNPVGVFVNVSNSEGLPVSIMEASSLGIPSVAADVGGTRELLSDGVSGFLLGRDFSDRELADAIERMARLPADEYEVFRRQARLNWERNFRAEVNYARFAEVIS
ncbi:MAG: glycosyltransferase [Oscillospiraceae bacterium]|nr:glycosyltransferase [Oscillospiraceae bacterium]